MKTRFAFALVALFGCASNVAESDGETLSASAKPRGIYVLDSSQGANGGIRNQKLAKAAYPFVTGFTWRMNWGAFESSKGVYDFSSLDQIVTELQALPNTGGKKKLTLLLGANQSAEPAYVAAEASATYTYVDNSTNAKVTRAVPWAASLATRFSAFVTALANHKVADVAAGGALVPMRRHSALANVNFGVAGLGEIRDREIRIRDLPGYTRGKFVSAITTSLAAVTAELPRKFVYVPMWAVDDNASSPALWQDILDAITTKFDGVTNPKVGLFEENLAAIKKNGHVTGFPSTGYAAPLYEGQGKTYTLFQALEGWQVAFADPTKVAGSTPGDALTYALTTFGCEYVELYSPDLDDSKYWPDYDAFNKAIGL